MNFKFEIKVFNSPEMFFEATERYLTETKDLIVNIKIFDDVYAVHNLMKYWIMLFAQCEGMNYCVIDVAKNKAIVSGTFEPDDMSSIEDYLGIKTEN